MTLHNVGAVSFAASLWGFLENWSGAFQSVAAICAIIAYAIMAYRYLKKKKNNGSST